ncbi:unnamed protein product [Diatraea saccharalis]|uniref:Uncharacterized protein n=1 Tax=Diatraea saccharalis TaxID=40085 RepID=A0A9N9RAE8_9NEOP|nr:unnamed protein product [Diatraea saccharalis]
MTRRRIKNPRKIEDVDVVSQEMFHNYIAHLKTKFFEDPDRYTKPITINIANAMMESIRRAKQKLKRYMPLYEFETTLLDLYDVTNKKDQQLILKPKNQGELERKVVSCEEAFSIIEKIHRDTTHHGSWNTVKKYLNDKLDRYIYEESYCISLIINLCCVCTPIFNTKCYFYVAESRLEPNNSFKKILILIDEATCFVRLRPLTSGTENEVAIELLKTFMDFGIPKNMISPDCVLLEKVLQVVNSLLPDYPMPKVSIGTDRHVDWKTHITNKLQECKAERNTNNWAILCHMVQWNLNTVSSHSRNSPYSIVFDQDAPKIHMSKPQSQTKTSVHINKADFTEITEKPNETKLKSTKKTELTDKSSKTKSKQRKITQKKCERKRNINLNLAHQFNLPIGSISDDFIDLTDDKINISVESITFEDVGNNEGNDVYPLVINDEGSNEEESGFTHCNNCKKPVPLVINKELPVTSRESTFCAECMQKNATKELLTSKAN